MSDLKEVIAELALLFAVVSFVVHVAYSMGWKKTSAQIAEPEVRSALAAVKEAPAGASPQQVIDLVNATATLADNLAKAGPALWTMIGAVLFLLVACFAAGVFPAA